MRPNIVCLMMTSPDGSLHPSRWTKSPDGSRSDWSKLYEKLHGDLKGQAWLVGRTTMAEMSKADAHPPAGPFDVSRSHHLARNDATSFGIAIDPGGKTHYKGGELFGDHIVVLLGRDVADSHLAELAADGISYFVSGDDEMDVGAMLEQVGKAFGISRIILEGGAATNGRMMADGLVDELSFIVAPALEARSNSDRVVEFGEDGLAGKVELSLIGCELLGHGAVHLRYAVKPAG